jgi:autotransporter passenger strand-loop-strand repeat protein
VVGVTLDGNATQTVKAEGIASGTTISATDTLIVESGGGAVAVVIAGGTLDVQAGGTVGGAVTFGGNGGVLQIDGAGLPTAPTPVIGATVSGFAPGDAIDLTGVPFASGGSATFGSGNVPTISEGGQSYTLDFDPAQAFINPGLHAERRQWQRHRADCHRGRRQWRDDPGEFGTNHRRRDRAQRRNAGREIGRH